MKIIWANCWRKINMNKTLWQLLLWFRAPVVMFAGCFVWLGAVLFGHIEKHYWDKNMLCLETYKQWWGGFSCGWVKVVNKNPDTHLLAHESGHQVQLAFLGDLWILVVGIPSMIRYQLIGKHPEKYKTYDYAWFEGTASQIGHELYLKDYNYEWLRIRRQWDEEHKR